MMPLGIAVVLLLVAAYFGFRVRAYLLGGGFWFPGRWRVMRAKDPITFWFVVVAYAAVATATAQTGLIGLFLGNHRISN